MQQNQARLPRGIRNNNPGNIDYNQRNQWRGQTGIEKGVSNPRFATFDKPENGIRAICILIKNYRKFYGIKSIRGILTRYAPGIENDTASYVDFVAKKSDTHPDAIISPRSRALVEIVKAIIRFENAGYEYPEEIVLKGIFDSLDERYRTKVTGAFDNKGIPRIDWLNEDFFFAEDIDPDEQVKLYEDNKKAKSKKKENNFATYVDNVNGKS